MFKYLWIIPLALGYIWGWSHSMGQLIYTIKTGRLIKFGLGELDYFTLGWLGTHLIGLFVLSFLAFAGIY